MRKNILILGHNTATQFIDIYNQYTRLFDPTHYHVTVACLTGAHTPAIQARLLAETQCFFNFPKKWLRYLKIRPLFKLWQLCRQQKFDMIICHRYKPIYLFLWIAQWYRLTQLIFVMHELGTVTALNRKLFIALCAKKNMLFAGVSNAVRDDLRKQLWRIPNERIITLYNVIDLDIMAKLYLDKVSARIALSLPTNDFLFGQLARLVPNKDQATLIHAFALLHQTYPETQLIIIGNGILEQTLKQLVQQYHLENHIHFLGYREQGARFMKAFDCFVLSSKQEAFGRVLLEAMGAHCPIIATRAHGIPEVLGNSNVLVEVGDHFALANAMKKMYEHSVAEREKITHHAYNHLMNHYTIPSFYNTFWKTFHAPCLHHHL